MTNKQMTKAAVDPLPDDARTHVVQGVSGIMQDLAAYSLSTEELQELIAGAVRDAVAQAGRKVDGTSPLTLVAASVAVAEAAEALTHLYVQQAQHAGYTWADVARAAGLASPQTAHWRWGKNARNVSTLTPAPSRSEAAAAGRPAPVAYAPLEDGWLTAAALGRLINKDPRTVREMAARGEVEVLRREPGRDGRVRDLYRAATA